MTRTDRPTASRPPRNTRYALMIAAAMQVTAPLALAESITVKDGQTVTTDKAVLSSLIVEDGGTFTSTADALRLEGDAQSRLSSNDVNINGRKKTLALNKDATLTLSKANVFGMLEAPTLTLSTDDNTNLNDTSTKLVIEKDTKLTKTESERGRASLLGGQNADIEIADGATLQVERGVANFRGTISGAGDLQFTDTINNFISPADGDQSTHTGNVFVEKAELALGEGALASSSSVTFRNNRFFDENGDAKDISTIDKDALDGDVVLTVDNDAYVKLDGKNKPEITHSTKELTVGPDSEVELTAKAKLRTQKGIIEGDISGTGALIFHGGQSSTIKTTGTTFVGTTQVIDRSTLQLETSGALGGSDILTLAGGSTVKARASNVFNNSTRLWTQTGQNRIDIRGPQRAGSLTLAEDSVVAFTSPSSDGNDTLTLTSGAQDSVIEGQFEEPEAGGTVKINGHTAEVNTRQSIITFSVGNNGHLIVNETDALPGTLSLNRGSKVTVNAQNGLNIQNTNNNLRIPANAEVIFNADQTLDLLSSNQTSSRIAVGDEATLTFANTSKNQFLDDERRSNYYGVLAGEGDYELAGGQLDIGAGSTDPTNKFSGTFSVTGNSTLQLSKSQAVSGNALTVSGGSTVDVQNGDNAFNDALDVTLNGTNDQLIIDTFIGSTQRIDSLNAGDGSTVQIKASRGNSSNLNSLVIGSDDGDSQIDGRIFGPGNLTIGGSGTTTINQALEITGDIAIKDQARVSLATTNALGDPGTLDLSPTGAFTLAIDAENAWDTAQTLSLPSASTLEVNADQRIDVLQAKLGKSRSGTEAASVSIADDTTLTLGAAGETLDLEGQISGAGNLVIADGTTHLGSRLGGNTFTGTTTVESGAGLTLTRPEALGGSRKLAINAGGTVDVDGATQESPFNDSMQVTVEGDLNLAAGNNNPLTYTIDTLELAKGGTLTFDNGERLELQGSSAESSIAGAIDGIGILSIGGTGTTHIETAISDGGFVGELRVLDSARVVVNAVDGLDVDNQLGGTPNVSIGAGTTLDLNVENAFKTLSEAGHSIADGARVNVNATDAVAADGDFTFNDADSTLAINDVAQTLSGELAGGGELLVTGTGALTLSPSDANPFNGTVTLEDTATLTVGADNALGTATLTGSKGTSLVLDARQELADGLDFGGSVSGSGTLVFNTQTEHSVPDTLDDFAGTLAIEAGSLPLNSTLGDATGNTGDVEIADGATLSGTGTVTGTATLADGATHAPGNSVGTQTVGDYTLADGATLEVELDTDSTGALINDRVEYTNSATLGDADGDTDGPTITVSTLDSGLFIANDTTLAVVTGDGVSNLTVNDPATLNITDGLDLLAFRGAGTAGEYRLTAERTGYAAISGAGLNAGQQQTAAALDGIAGATVTGSGSDTQSLLVRLDGLGQAVVDDTTGARADYQAALSSLSGERLLSADAAWFEGARRWSEGIGTVIDQARGLGDAHPFHVSVYADTARTDASAERPGFDRDSTGFAISAERPVTARGYVGAALGYERADSDFDRNGGNSEQQSAHTAVRYAFEPRGDLRLSATAVAGFGRFDTHRPIATDNRTAHSDPDAWQAGLQLDGEHRFALTPTRRLTAIAGVGYLYADRAGFDETGDASVSLQSVQARALDSLTSRLGLALSDRIEWGSTTLRPHLQLVWVHDFSADEDPLKATLAAGDTADAPSSSIRLTDRDRDADRLRLDSGVTLTLGEHTEARIGYAGEIAEQSTAHQLRAGLTLRF